MLNKHLILNANCIPVKGARRSIICDLQLNKFYYVPNSLFNILQTGNKLKISNIYSEYSLSNQKVIEEYINFLLEHDLAFLCEADEINYFPDLSMRWNTSSIISNIIIDLDANFLSNFELIATQLDALGCKAIQFRSFTTVNLHEMTAILEAFKYSRSRHIELYLKFDSSFSKETLSNLIEDYPRVNHITFHSCEFGNQQELGKYMVEVIYLKTIIDSCFRCGSVALESFSLGLEMFTEAQHHNTCLNRKISIDTHGNIKNCPSMTKSYGNIQDTTLAEALEHPDFKQYWNIHKDQIEVCKDCEFRYICTDCRAYREDPDNLYSKPLKCGYNPYTAEWEEWSTNPLKQKAIAHYGMEELVKK